VIAFCYGILATKIRKEQTCKPSQGRADDMVKGMESLADTYIKVWPASIDISVYPVQERVSRRAAGLTDKG
jgi:hypothetical protein